MTEAENRLRKNNAKKDESENFMVEGERTRALTEDEKQENLLPEGIFIDIMKSD